MLADHRRVEIASALLGRQVGLDEIASMLGGRAFHSPLDFRVAVMDTEVFRKTFPDVHFALVARSRRGVERALQAHDLLSIRDEVTALREDQRKHAEKGHEIAERIDGFIQASEDLKRRSRDLDGRIDQITAMLFSSEARR